MRILVIEDDIETANYIARGLKEHGHTVDQADDGKDGLFMALEHDYDIIILDRMLPALDGLSILKTLRSSDRQTPVIILSALGEVDDRVQGLKAGGDDYLVKPFAFSELLARIEALLRRGEMKPETSLLKVADLELDRLTHTVKRAGKTPTSPATSPTTPRRATNWAWATGVPVVTSPTIKRSPSAPSTRKMGAVW